MSWREFVEVSELAELVRLGTGEGSVLASPATT